MTLHTLLAFMSFGFGELLIIGTVALLVFGGQLPDVMRNLGRAYARLKDGLHEVSKPVRDELREVGSMPNPRREIQSALTRANEPLDQPVDEVDSEYALSNGEEGEPQPWPGSSTADGAEPTAEPLASPPPRFEEDDDEPLPP